MSEQQEQELRLTCALQDARDRAAEMEARYDRLTLDVERLWKEAQMARAAQAVAVASEREACALILDGMASQAEADIEPSSVVRYYREKAAEIRARGKE